MSKNSITKTSTIVDCVLLSGMALFHGSGIIYVTELVQQSNAKPFIKEIFPVLFVHPSIHLLGLAALGILTLFMKYEIGKILLFISILVFINAVLAFFLNATIPGILLILSAFIFGLAASKSAK